MIMSWLIDENSQHGLKALAKEILGKEPKKWKDLTKQVSLFVGEQEIMEELAKYCCEDVENTYALYQHFYPQLEKNGVLVDYEKVELRIIPVLMNMEMRGIKVDVSWLEQKQKEAKAELQRLDEAIKKKVAEIAPRGEVILLRSPQQLEKLLFDILKYPVIKQTPAGKRSTDNEVLQEIIKQKKLKEDDILPML